ncbi:MAG: hypothetical protein P0S95_02980 [Rhabdochlamydiaceae bacterium]|nr:hypothetical protein [Candidatus Amphrikana amoebophyrae]
MMWTLSSLTDVATRAASGVASSAYYAASSAARNAGTYASASYTALVGGGTPKDVATAVLRETPLHLDDLAEDEGLQDREATVIAAGAPTRETPVATPVADHEAPVAAEMTTGAAAAAPAPAIAEFDVDTTQSKVAQVAQVSKQLERFTTRLSNLIVYYFAAMMCGFFDENSNLIKGAYAFAGSKSNENVFDPKNPDHFLKKLRMAINKSPANFLIKKAVLTILSPMHNFCKSRVRSLGNEAINYLNEEILAPMTTGSDEEVAARVLDKAKDLLLDLMGDFKAEYSKDSKELLADISLSSQEKRLVKEKALHRVCGKETNPYQYLAEATDAVLGKGSFAAQAAAAEAKVRAEHGLDSHTPLNANLTLKAMQLQSKLAIEANPVDDASDKVWDFIATKCLKSAKMKRSEYDETIDTMAKRQVGFKMAADKRSMGTTDDDIAEAREELLRKNPEEDPKTLDQKAQELAAHTKRGKMYANLCQVIVRRFLGEQLTFVSMPGDKVREIFTKLSASDDANLIIKVIQNGIAGFIAAMIGLAYLCAYPIKGVTESLKDLILEQVVKIVGTIFAGIVGAASQSDGFERKIYSYLNKKPDEVKASGSGGGDSTTESPPIEIVKKSAALYDGFMSTYTALGSNGVRDWSVTTTLDLFKKEAVSYIAGEVIQSVPTVRKLTQTSADDGLEFVANIFDNWDAPSVDARIERSKGREQRDLFYADTLPEALKSIGAAVAANTPDAIAKRVGCGAPTVLNAIKSWTPAIVGNVFAGARSYVAGSVTSLSLNPTAEAAIKTGMGMLNADMISALMHKGTAQLIDHMTVSADKKEKEQAEAKKIAEKKEAKIADERTEAELQDLL